MKNYLQFDFEISNETESDSLVAVLSDNNFDGFEQTENCLKAYIDQDLFTASKFNNITRIFPLLRFTKATVENINWNAEWEANFHPVEVGNFAGVRAHFHPKMTDVQHEIIITPKMSFGTGHHATTFMMMEMMEAIDFSGKSVADFGTGTGILAILAYKLGASTIAAIDIDEWSIDNAKENVIQNNTAGIELILSDKVPNPGLFDIILANINLNIILENLPAVSKSANKGGIVLLSGFLKCDEQLIKEALILNGLEFIAATQQKEWIAVIAQKMW